jgi:N-acetylneuraminate synthase
MNSIKIADRKVDDEHPPLIVAEMSGNHNQSLDRALQIVDAAAKTGAQAIKLQTYTADTMTLDLDSADFFISESTSLWQGTSLYKLYNQAYTPWEWHKPIFDRCRELGIIAFSTPFDETAVDFLETLGVPCYKIASFEVTDLPLIEKVAATGKPMIISAGMTTVAELDEAVRTARAVGCRDIVLLKCTSAYPSTPEDSNLLTIPSMRELFNCQVGLSDHTLGIGVALAAVALGAAVIEKHFTTCRSDGGVDAAFSMEPLEMEMLVTESRRAWQSLGHIQYGPSEQEKDSLKYRRSLYIAQDMKQGDTFTPDNLRIIRPGYGLEPKYYKSLLGKSIKRDVAKGTPVSWDLL